MNQAQIYRKAIVERYAAKLRAQRRAALAAGRLPLPMTAISL